MIDAREFGELRSLFATTPSAEGFAAICEHVSAALAQDAARTSQELFPFLKAQLRAWPASIKLAPARWVERALDGAPSPGLSLCTRLDLSMIYLEADQLERLLSISELGALRVLNLWSMGLAERQLIALFKSPYCPQLSVLNLSRNHLDDAAVVRLFRASGRFIKLKRLSLAQNDLGAGCTGAIVAAPLIERLSHLNLYGNHIGDEGALRLSEAPIKGPLDLELRENAISASGAQALASASFLTEAQRKRWAQAALI